MFTLPTETAERLRALFPDHLRHVVRGVQRALADLGLDAVALHSGATVSKTRFDDQSWPFRPLPPFAHLAPLSEPDAVVVVTSSGDVTLHRCPNLNFWEGPLELPLDLVSGHFDVRVHRSVEALSAALPRGARSAVVTEDFAQATRLGFSPEAFNPPALLKALDTLRVLKTPYEVACLAEANRRAALGHAAVAQLFRQGAEASELELHLAFLNATGQDDPETPYKNILALGANAATLHHVSYGRRPSSRQSESLLVDAGATCMGYASDITRTYARGPSSDAALSTFQQLVRGVDALQRRLCDEVALDLPYEALHDRSHDLLGALLAETGVVRCGADEAVASGLTRVVLPHGLGHSLGLCTHDAGCAELRPRADNPFLRNTTRIAAGQVFTIEPGVYFIEMLLAPLRGEPRGALVNWALVAQLAPLGGVRVEDDLHVLADGRADNLTRAYLASMEDDERSR